MKPIQAPESTNSAALDSRGREEQLNTSQRQPLMSEILVSLTRKLQSLADMDAQLSALSSAEAQSNGVAHLRGARFAVDGFQIEVALPKHAPLVTASLEEADKLGVPCVPEFITTLLSVGQDSAVIISHFTGASIGDRVVTLDDPAVSIDPQQYQAYIRTQEHLATLGRILERSDDPTNMVVNTRTGFISLMAIKFREVSPEEAKIHVDKIRTTYRDSKAAPRR